MKRIVIVIALICLVGAIGSTPYRVQEISVGGGPTDTVDGGAQIEKDGTITTSGQIVSTKATGTAPFSIASTTLVANLNAALLNGLTWASPGNIGTGTPGTGHFTTLTVDSTSTQSGGFSVPDNQYAIFGTDSDIKIWYDETTNDRLEFKNGTTVREWLYPTTGNFGVTGSAAADSAVIGGGYGSTGATISNAGAITANGAILSDSTLTGTGGVRSGAASVTLSSGFATLGASSGGWYKIAQIVCSAAYSYLDMFGEIQAGDDSASYGKFCFSAHFRGGNDLASDAPIVRYQVWCTDTNIATWDQAFPPVRVVKTSDAVGGNKTYELQVCPINSTYGMLSWDLWRTLDTTSWTATAYTTTQTAGTALSSANTVASGDAYFFGDVTTTGAFVQSGNYQGIATTENLVGLWHCAPLNGTAGTTMADYSGNNETMTAIGTGGIVSTAGKYGSCITLAGAAAWKTTMTDIPNTVGAGDHSQSVWFKIASKPAAWSALCGWTNIGIGFTWDLLQVYTDGKVRAYITTGNGNEAWVWSTNSVCDGAWHHAVSTVATSAHTISLYVDGILQGSDNTYTGDPHNTLPFRIGSYTDGTGAPAFLTGSIDEVSVWSKALSESEVRALYMAQQSLVKEPGGEVGVSRGQLALNTKDATHIASIKLQAPNGTYYWYHTNNNGALYVSATEPATETDGYPVPDLTSGASLWFGAHTMQLLTELYSIGHLVQTFRIKDADGNTFFTLPDEGTTTAAEINGSLAVGTTNISGKIITPASTQNLTAVGNTISSATAYVRLTSNAAYTLTSTPTIAAGVDGQELKIENGDSADNIVLQDKDTLPSSGLQLTAATITLTPGDFVHFTNNGTYWCQDTPVSAL